MRNRSFFLGSRGSNPKDTGKVSPNAFTPESSSDATAYLAAHYNNPSDVYSFVMSNMRGLSNRDWRAWFAAAGVPYALEDGNRTEAMPFSMKKLVTMGVTDFESFLANSDIGKLSTMLNNPSAVYDYLLNMNIGRNGMSQLWAVLPFPYTQSVMFMCKALGITDFAGAKASPQWTEFMTYGTVNGQEIDTSDLSAPFLSEQNRATIDFLPSSSNPIPKITPISAKGTGGQPHSGIPGIIKDQPSSTVSDPTDPGGGVTQVTGPPLTLPPENPFFPPNNTSGGGIPISSIPIAHDPGPDGLPVDPSGTFTTPTGTPKWMPIALLLGAIALLK